jgi:hypothetical protein
MGIIYGPTRVSTDEYMKILTEQERRCNSSKMCGEIIFAVAYKNHSQIIPTNTDEYGLVLNGCSLYAESVSAIRFLPTVQTAIRDL